MAEEQLSSGETIDAYGTVVETRDGLGLGPARLVAALAAAEAANERLRAIVQALKEENAAREEGRRVLRSAVCHLLHVTARQRGSRPGEDAFALLVDAVNHCDALTARYAPGGPNPPACSTCGATERRPEPSFCSNGFHAPNPLPGPVEGDTETLSGG